MTAILHRHRPADRAQDFDRRLIAPMILGSILNPVNSSLIAVALVPIGAAFGAPAAQTAWLVSALYLATAVGQPVVGRLVDLYGPRPLFVVGAALVGLGGLIGATAPSLGVLVLARVVVGLGTCAGYPAAMSLIRSEAARTGRSSPAGILTLLSVATQTVVVIGPSLGGLLIGLGGWRATFAVNVPVALLALAFGLLRLPKATERDDAAAGSADGSAERIDYAGIALFTATLIALLLFLMHPQPGRWYLLLVTAVAAAGLAGRELRAPSPFIDLRLLAGNLPLLLTYARALLAAITSYALLYGFTQWLEDGRGLSASVAGLALLPIFAGGIAVSATTGRHPQIRGKLAVGALTQVAVAVALLFLGSHSALWTIILIALLAGVPQGLNNLANQNAVYYQADPDRIGSSAGLLRTFFYLGAIAASTANGIVFPDGATTGGLHHLALVMLVASGAFALLVLADRSLDRVVAASH